MPQRKGIEIEDLKEGTGPEATRGSTVEVRYNGYLRRGDRFQENTQCRFTLGKRHVIAGLDYGIEGMRVGGCRRICVSPHLAYGSRGLPGVIPANAVLIFEVELLTVEDETGRKSQLT